MKPFCCSALIAILTALPWSSGQAAIMEESVPALFGEGDRNSESMSLPEFSATNAFGNLLNMATADQELLDEIIKARKVAAENPMVPRHYRELGELLTRANRMDEAAEAYWHSSRLDPLNAAPLHYLGFTLLAIGDHENGLKIYKLLESRYPDARKVRFNLGAAYYGLQDYNQASIYFDSYIQTARRDDPRMFYNYGITLLAAGKPADAVMWLEKSADRLSSNPFVLAALVRAHTKLGHEETLKELEKVIEQNIGMLRIKPILEAPTLPVFIDH